jgi:hypothetical protein
MGRNRGNAARGRGRTRAYAGFGRAARSWAARLAAVCVAALVLAPAASAQSTGGATPQETAPEPKLSAPPPGVVVRPAPELR